MPAITGLQFFNSRPLVEVDSSKPLSDICFIFFNSRPLVEVDRTCRKLITYMLFSTHDLSWRSTKAYLHRGNHVCFSTHDLSWRSTNTACYSLSQHSFSTHDLSWRSTAKLHNKSLKFCIFSGHFILEQMSLPFSYKYH